MRWMLPLLILGLASVGCDSDIDEDAFIVDGVLVDTPTGGHNFGELDHFDVASHETDITGINDADGFPFSLSEDSLVVISMESLDGLNGFVEIYDEDGEFIAGDDDSGVSEDALIVGDFEAGDYTIVAWASEEGSYFGD
ncbi:MAG: hypothetical protein L6Q71_11175, partial [Planctomycetes bacterium]|nr:hypothetical protein [Planctomycetota bacterium]